jgi:hypothetical protein
LPENSLKTIVNPKGIPIIAARMVEVIPTLTDTPTMDIISASSEITSKIAEIKLSIRRSIK